MEIISKFELPLPPPEAWRLLTDLERVAPCAPGLTVEAVDGDELRGTMRIKVGPITTSYKTSVRIAERDEEALRAVLEASGREIRGQGTVSAAVTATMAPAGGNTRVDLATDLAVTGRVAQFGRGAIVEVADRLLDQFAEQLAREGLNRADGAHAPDAGRAVPDDRPAPSAPPPKDPLDLGGALASTRAAAALRAAVVAAMAGLLLWRLLRR